MSYAETSADRSRASQLISAAARLWSPPKYPTPDLWADSCRILPPGSPFPGQWSTDLTPYLRAPMRSFADPHTDVVVLIVTSQMGKTEAGFNVMGWMWDTCPAPAMWVLPTMKLAITTSRDRLNSMFKTVPGLWERLDKTFRKAGSLERWVDGMRFGLAWAGSSTELASHPVKYAIVDERTRMGNDTGGEGDPVGLVQARTKMFEGSKVGVFSSPGEEGLCPTYRWWLSGTRMRWCWRCPGCGEWIFPTLALAGYPEKAEFSTIRAEAWIECPTCQHQIRDEDRDSLEAQYIPGSADENGDIVNTPDIEVRNSVASYWATGFSSPTTGIGGVMEHYARAARLGEIEDVRAAVNTYAGELFKHSGDGARSSDVKDCCVSEIPADQIGLVTMGVDVQENSLYYVVRGWGEHQTSWLLDHGQIYGSTEFDDVYLALANVAEQTYCGLSVTACMIDSGFRTAQVYEVCRRNPRFCPTKGAGISKRSHWPTKTDVTPTGKARSTLMLWNYDSDHWLMWLRARILWPKDKPGAWYVPDGIDDEYCTQVTCERWRITRGRREWYLTGSRDNHLGDCEVLAAVGAYAANVRQLVVRKERPKPEAKPPDSFVEQRKKQVNSSREVTNDPFTRRPL